MGTWLRHNPQNSEEFEILTMFMKKLVLCTKSEYSYESDKSGFFEQKEKGDFYSKLPNSADLFLALPAVKFHLPKAVLDIYRCVQIQP